MNYCTPINIYGYRRRLIDTNFTTSTSGKSTEIPESINLNEIISFLVSINIFLL
jgi:hypothetical protein